MPTHDVADCAALENDLAVIRSLSAPADNPAQTGLVILYGLPGSGKSWFADLVARRTPAVILNSDRLRSAIIAHPRYDGDENKRLFTAMFRRTAELLAQGQTVIFDSTALRYWARIPLESIADERGLTPVRVHLDPPESVMLSRLDARQEAPDSQDAAKTWPEVYYWMKPGWEAIVESHLKLANPDDAPAMADTVAQMLYAAGGKHSAQ